MKVIDLKAAKAASERKRYTDAVLKEFDRQEHSAKRELLDKRSEIQRKARKEL